MRFLIAAKVEENELAEYALLAMEFLDPILSKYRDEINVIGRHLDQRSRLTKRQLMIEIDRLEKDYSEDEEEEFYSIYRILKGDRFNFSPEEKRFVFFSARQRNSNPVKEYIEQAKSEFSRSLLFSVVSAGMVFLLPWSLIFCFLFFGREKTLFIIALLLEDAMKTAKALIKAAFLIIALVILIIGLISR
jgi:hypothetical protein